MNRKSRFTLVSVAAMTAAAGSFALAQSANQERPGATQTRPGANQEKPAANQEIPLPPGWTEADMQACMEAGTPGPMHEYLAKGAGNWRAKTMMWMAPDTEPMSSEGTCTVTSIMDGRFVNVDMNGDMPGMGPYHGVGIYGFDNVAQEFQCTWFDNHSTSLMMGTGELSSDGSTLTWEFNYNCPITKKPAVFREIERRTGNNAKTLTMYGTDPKSGREYKMMEIKFTRDSSSADANAGRGG